MATTLGAFAEMAWSNARMFSQLSVMVSIYLDTAAYATLLFLVVIFFLSPNLLSPPMSNVSVETSYLSFKI